MKVESSKYDSDFSFGVRHLINERMKWFCLLFFVSVSGFGQSCLLPEPFTKKGNLYIKISGGLPPYQIQGPATGGNFVPLIDAMEGDTVNRLFLVAYSDTNINPGVTGNYLVRDAQNNGCATPFTIWNTAQLQANLRLEGYHFVQSPLRFDTCTIARNARIFCYGKPLYDPGRPGGNVSGASLEKTGYGNFMIDTGAVIRGQCESMWPGIKIIGPNGLNTQFSMRPLSRIEDAFAGIEVSGNIENLALEVDSAAFVNNYIGILNKAKTGKRITIHRSLFEATDLGLKQPFQAGQVHNGDTVRFTGLAGIMNGGGTVKPIKIERSRFSNLLVAISGTGAPMQIKDNLIEKIRARAISLGTGNPQAPYLIENNQIIFDKSPILGWIREDTVFEKYKINFDPGDGGSLAFPNRAMVGITAGESAEIKNNRIEVSNTLQLPFSIPIAGAWLGAGVHRLEGNQFKNMDIGIIRTQPDTIANTIRLLEIKQNVFSDMGETGIKLHRGRLNLRLQCNLFEQPQAIDTISEIRKGIVIGDETILLGNRIGGDNNQTVSGSPNSNYFPRIVDTNGVIRPYPGYYSVWNESGNLINYYSFSNEDLGKVHPEFQSGLPNYIRPIPLAQVSITRKNLENWCNEIPPTATQPNWQSSNLQTIGQVSFNNLSDCREMNQTELGILKSFQLIPNNWVLACEGGPLDNIAFPIPRLLAPNLISEVAESINRDKVYLGQSIPNPAKDRVTIPIFLSELKGKAVVEIFELGSGKRFDKKYIETLGQHMVEFEVLSLPAGIYGYRLLVPEGKSPLPKKMVLVK